jgi:hypothetical protein
MPDLDATPVRSHAPGCPCNTCMPCRCEACQAFRAAFTDHLAVMRSGAPRDMSRDVLMIATALVEEAHPGKSYPDPEYMKARQN